MLYLDDINEENDIMLEDVISDWCKYYGYEKSIGRVIWFMSRDDIENHILFESPENAEKWIWENQSEWCI